MIMSMRLLLPLLIGLLSCERASEVGDPCEPNGHIHRSAQEDDWCHCFEGYVAASDKLACEIDPNYQPPGPFVFEDTTTGACWHAQNGPFENSQTSLTRFKTVYTLDLAPRPDGLYSGVLTFKAWKTGRFGVFAGPTVPFGLYEGVLGVSPRVQSDITLCPELTMQYGYELISRVEYRLEFGPTSTPQVRVMVDEVP